jgi:probable rRNA maturation factor
MAHGEEPCPLGDVVLAAETVQREAEGQAIPLADHAAHLVVHGMLHLLGFDHERADDAERMEALETQALAGLGIADPYAEPVKDAAEVSP